jgi:glycosyltransferase involved in cell wall biosynthesis
MLTRPHEHLGRGPFAERVLAEAAGADIVHLEEVHTAVFARMVEAPSLIHLHYLDRMDRPAPPPWRKEMAGYVEFRRAEWLAARSTRFLAASSPIVADYLRRVSPNADVTRAPLSLDPSLYEPTAHDGPSVAGMIGTAWWPPTRSAIDRLLGTLWPLVRAGAPASSLRLAGRGLADLELGSQAGVEILGEVDEAATFLAGLSVLLYPVSRGSGMKVKVLEALACGVPVVTTPEGAEGIGPHDGVVVESSDERLARAAIELLTDRAARRERGAAARRLFEERFSPGPATRPLLAAYDRMLAAGSTK